MVEIGKQYAKALFDVAVKRDRLDECRVNLEKLIGYFDEVEELWPFMLDYSINKEDKKKVVSVALGDSFGEIFLNFIKVLIDRNAIKFLPDIEKDYNKLYNEHCDIIELKVTSALALQEEELRAIEDRYKEKFLGFSIKIVNIVDRSIIGGLRIEYRDRVVDATLKTKLMKLKEHIVSNEVVVE